MRVTMAVFALIYDRNIVAITNNKKREQEGSRHCLLLSIRLREQASARSRARPTAVAVQNLRARPPPGHTLQLFSVAFLLDSCVLSLVYCCIWMLYVLFGYG